MSVDTELCQLSATAIIRHFEAGELSPVDVTKATLAEIERLDPQLNAFCLVTAEQALAQARASEKRWQDGEPLGLIDGVPVGLKDVFATEGHPTLKGCKLVDKAGPWEHDAPATRAIKAHGGVIVGKTTTPEMGWKAVTDSPLHGVTRNPWDTSRTPGGSSGGTSAALAAGLCAVGPGTDGGGSIRIPASFTGTVGLKPTYGRVPHWPNPPYGTLAHAGPMARTVADCALIYDVLSHPDRRDWTALPSPSQPWQQATVKLAGLRVALSPGLGFVSVDREIEAAVRDAAGKLAELGADVVETDPAIEDPFDIWATIWNAGAASIFVGRSDSELELIDPGLRGIVEAGRKLTAIDLVTAGTRRDQIGMALRAFHADFDLLLTAATPMVAFDAGRDVPTGWHHQHWATWAPLSYVFNVTQQPALSLPWGLSSDGLPIGIQLVGDRYADDVVLATAAALEATTSPMWAPMVRS